MNRPLRTPRKVYWTLAAGFAVGAACMATVQSGKFVPIAVATPAEAPARLASSTTTESMTELRSLDASFANLAAYALPAVVDIRSVTERAQGPNGERVPVAGGTGSGFIYRPDGYIITNDHVVGGFDKVTVVLQDGREFPGRVIRASEQDIAIVKIEAKDLPTLALSDSKTLRPGQFAMALGAPFGLESSVTVGHVSAIHRSERQIEDRVYADLIQTDTAINRGNSGGPLINIEGQVIGVNTAIFSPSGTSAGIGFSIPSNQVRLIADMLIEKGKVTRAYMGIAPETLKPFQEKELNVEGGAVAKRVEGPALAAGLKQEDIITKIGDRKIDSSVDMRNSMLMYAPGAEVDVQYLRNGKPGSAKVKLGTPPTATRRELPNGQRDEDGDGEFSLPPGFQRVPEGEMPDLRDFMDRFRRNNSPEGRQRPDRTPDEPAERTSKPQLGVEVAPISDAMRRQFSVPAEQKGVIVASVTPGSIASTLGIRTGDVITGFGSTTITSPQQLVDVVKSVKRGESRKVSFVRFSGNARREVAVDVTF